MKMPIISLMIILLSIPAYAEDIFPDREIREIQIIMISEENATIQDKQGVEAAITIGDRIGIEKGEVTEIGKAYVTIQTRDTKTRMPLIHGFER